MVAVRPSLPRRLLEELNGGNERRRGPFSTFKRKTKSRKELRQEKKQARKLARRGIHETTGGQAADQSDEVSAKKNKTIPRDRAKIYESLIHGSYEDSQANDEADARYYAKKLGQKSLKLTRGKDGLDEILGELNDDEHTNLSEYEDSDTDLPLPEDEIGNFDVPLNEADDVASMDGVQGSALSEDDEQMLENTSTSGVEVGSDAEQGVAEEFIENPWTDDSLSESDFESADSDFENETAEFGNPTNAMTAEETMAALARAKKSKLHEDQSDLQSGITAKKQNPYIPDGSDSEVRPAAYVPPRRRASGPVDGEDKLKKHIQGALNKLAEANIGTILSTVETCFLNHPRGIVSEILTQQVLDATATSGQAQESLLTVKAGLVVALHRTIGTDFGAQFVQALVERLEDVYNKTLSTDENKEASNLLLLLVECYSLDLVSSRLVYDLLNLFLNEMSEINTELILLVIRNCGAQLRSDDPAALKDIIVLLQDKLSGTEEVSLRSQFLVECIIALKNNRPKSMNEVLRDTRRRVRKFLSKLPSNEALQVALADIRNVDTRGKWWLVGAAWAGGIVQSTEDADYEAIGELLTNEPNWLSLAKQQRLNTDIRRAVFIALMSAEDYLDACQRIDKLRLKSKQEREVPNVILHCLANEATYNPYYALVAAHQCTRRSTRKALQYAIWNILDDVEDGNIGVKKALHYARFVASLISQSALTLDVLRNVDFVAASSDTRLLLEMILVHLYQTLGKRCETNREDLVGQDIMDETPIVELLSRVKEELVLRGILYFHPVIAKSTIMSGSKKQRTRVLNCNNLMSNIIQRILKTRPLE